MTILPDNVLTKMSTADRKSLGRAGMTADEAQERIEARSEKELQKLIAQDLRRRGVPFLQNAMHKRHTGTIGTPDFICFLNGSLLLMEIKHGKGKLSPEQEKLHADLKTHGFTVHVVTSFTQYNELRKGGVDK